MKCVFELVVFVLLNLINFDAICSIRGQAEREFKVEVEAIGRVRHKNLVRLLGYCAEGNQRYLLVWTIALVYIVKL